MLHQTSALALILALELVPCFPGPSTADREASEDVAFWRGVRNCGPNCLYLMLSAAGKEVSYRELLEKIEVGARGTTLVQLRDAARAIGHDVEVYKGTPVDLETISLPVLLHLDRDSGDIRGMGHFVLLTAYNQDIQEATLFDGTTGAPTAITFEALRRSWSGYLLCLEPASRAWPFFASMGTTIGICFLLGALRRYRRC